MALEIASFSLHQWQLWNNYTLLPAFSFPEHSQSSQVLYSAFHSLSIFLPFSPNEQIITARCLAWIHGLWQGSPQCWTSKTKAHRQRMLDLSLTNGLYRHLIFQYSAKNVYHSSGIPELLVLRFLSPPTKDALEQKDSDQILSKNGKGTTGSSEVFFSFFTMMLTWGFKLAYYSCIIT